MRTILLEGAGSFQHLRERGLIKASSLQVFRYPGAKAKLAAAPSFLSTLSRSMPFPTFYEGFAGSAAVSLSMAVRFPELKFSICDKDPEIASFWSLLAHGTDSDIDMFYDLLSIPPTVNLFYYYRANPPKTLPEKAYRAVFFNRTTFSGIALASPIGGRRQESEWKIGCRYNAKSMISRVGKLRQLFAGRLEVTAGTCSEWLNGVPRDAPLYLDPPYYVKGPTLYRHAMTHDEHISLSLDLRERRNWVLSYDDCQEIRDMYHGFADIAQIDFTYSIRGGNGVDPRAHVEKKELLISARVT